jgi:RNA polymerase-binding transcription factor DksA
MFSESKTIYRKITEMNDSKNISKKYKKRYEELILLRRQMISQINALEDSMIVDRAPGEELADVGSNNFSSITNISILNTEEIELDQIDDAIEQMIAGKYGICQDCGEAIEPARLDAKPFAKYCIKHKELRELREQGYDV